MYKYRERTRTQLTSVELLEGEPIEHKIERIVSNQEPITDGAPEIFTERKEGVKSAYNIRTDRWEVATEAMDKVSGSIQAKRDNKAKARKAEETKVVDMKGKEVGGTESIDTKAK
jgi:hypothetical protein